ncbi:MAG: hypothetical protein IJD68_07545 [Ruminococcus sp.]|nr:hypothetical protein [Ruminococcus sp.]MBQ4129608.1 hypothetical protein [Ruminococcus sp.]
MIIDTIEIDVDKLPVVLQERIKELHELDESGDWLEYSIKAEQIEVVAKRFLLSGVITSKIFELICMKYGGVEV